MEPSITMANSNPINRSQYYYHKISKLVYAMGASNYWYEELNVSKSVKNIHEIVTKVVDVMLCLYFVLMWGSFYTQDNMSNKQITDSLIFSICYPILYIFIPVLRRNAEKVQEVAYNLCVKMKETYNDEEVESLMVKRAKVYLVTFNGFIVSSVGIYGVNGVVNVVTKGGTFITVLTAWPDIDDRSLTAGVGRIIIYLLWCILALRIISVAYVTVILMTITLSHQYKNLCSYFRSLNNIFEDETISHEEQERKYEAAFKVGIEMHSNTLRCTKLIQEICDVVFSIQIFFNITGIIIAMIQMVNSERSLTNLMSSAVVFSSILLSTGCLWWNAGDVTVEASHLATAMFSSGWQHCRREAARRIRPMVVIAMWQGQIPVELRCCLNIIMLSYSSYVAIAKSSYSVFSVLY